MRTRAKTVNITIRSSSTLIRLSTAGKETGQTSWRQSNREHAETYVSGETTWMHAGLEACTCSWTHAHRTASQHVDAANVHVSLHACMPLCKRARGTCMRARRRASVHEAHARVLVEYACVQRGTCMRARRCACVHEAHARVLEDVRACRAACWLARMMFWLARAPGLQAPQG